MVKVDGGEFPDSFEEGKGPFDVRFYEGLGGGDAPVDVRFSGEMD